MTATAFGCDGNTIKLRQGSYLDLANPKPGDFTFKDIACGLSKICRFGGQIPQFYSVAEHCCHCLEIALADGLPIETVRAVLLHDATEAFLGDIVKPLKVMLPDYRRVEALMEAAVEEKFGINFAAHKAAIEEIDHSMLIAERRAMFFADSVKWTGEDQARPLNVAFKWWPPTTAEIMFTELAHRAGLEISESAKPFQMHDRVIFSRDFPAHHVGKQMIGTIIHIYEGNTAYEVECLTKLPNGIPYTASITVEPNEIEQP